MNQIIIHQTRNKKTLLLIVISELFAFHIHTDQFISIPFTYKDTSIITPLGQVLGGHSTIVETLHGFFELGHYAGKSKASYVQNPDGTYQFVTGEKLTILDVGKSGVSHLLIREMVARWLFMLWVLEGVTDDTAAVRNTL